jgi:hypothetical protein
VLEPLQVIPATQRGHRTTQVRRHPVGDIARPADTDGRRAGSELAS